MMNIILEATKRIPGNASMVREQGKIPAILYGTGIEPISLAFDYAFFEKMYNQSSGSGLLSLQLDGKEYPAKVFVQDVQYDPVLRTISHVDLLQIDMNKEMKADIELRLTGEAPAVKELGGTLVTNHETVEVKCLPKDLPEFLSVDISGLKEFSDVFKIKDLQLPNGVVALDAGDTVIVTVIASLTEDQIKAMEAAGPQSMEEIKDSEEKKKKEDAEEPEKGDNKKEKK